VQADLDCIHYGARGVGQTQVTFGTPCFVTDSLEPFSNKSKTLCADPSSALGSTIKTFGSQCVCQCLLHVSKARLVSSRSYSDHDVNCNYMPDASKRCLCIPISLNLNHNNTIIIITNLYFIYFVSIYYINL
jgi:hypothetical protein